MERRHIHHSILNGGNVPLPPGIVENEWVAAEEEVALVRNEGTWMKRVSST